MRVALVVPPLRGFSNRRMPIGLMSLASCLRQARPAAEIAIVDKALPFGTAFSGDNVVRVMEMIVADVLAWDATLVGITCTTPDFHCVLEIAARLKQGRPEVRVVVGGPHAILRPGEFFEHSSDIDYVVTGEAERLFPEFAAALEGGGKVSLQGVWSRDEGQIVDRGYPDLVEDLDSLPFPAYDLVDMEKYLYPDETTIRPLILSGAHLMSSRGCPYVCKFCANFTVYGRRVRYRSPANIVDEIEMLKGDWGIDSFFFYDETFTLKKQHVKGVCDELVRRGIRLPWGCQTRVNHVDEECYRLMKRAGCVQMEFGIEAGNERGWRALQKGINREQVLTAFSLAHRTGMRTLANFMVNIPDETEEDIRDIQSLIREIKPTACLANVMTPYPGTPVAEDRGGIPVEEYKRLRAMDLDDYFDFLDTRWRYAAHTLPVQEARRRVYAAARLSSPIKLLTVFDALYGWRHLLLIGGSKRRWAYLRQYALLVLRRLRHGMGEGCRLLVQLARQRASLPGSASSGGESGSLA